jgi:hypothetical protein
MASKLDMHECQAWMWLLNLPRVPESTSDEVHIFLSPGPLHASVGAAFILRVRVVHNDHVCDVAGTGNSLMEAVQMVYGQLCSRGIELPKPDL